MDDVLVELFTSNVSPFSFQTVQAGKGQKNRRKPQTEKLCFQQLTT
ncbi:hypothetical protein T01_9616 [Trichinella spiralis]|uniref:Uncharacterized protein n=1 Tax=Trichinella spiralis TaxID=6334 RepID=A0A0V1ALV1_TRISP|nr:hypothetical protein T01_9616 [Trichinella spiralis]